MADYKVNLSAGTQTEIGAVGNYYRILEASGDVWIGIDGGPLQKRGAGIGEQVEGGFSRLTLYSDIDQAVLLSVSRGRIDDDRLTLTPGAVVQVDSGSLKSGVFNIYLLFTNGDGQIQEMVAPTINVNGLRLFAVFCSRSSTGVTRVCAAPSLPADILDPSARTLLLATDGSTSNDPVSAIGLPLVIPPGYGIYVASSVDAAVNAGVEYEVL